MDAMGGSRCPLQADLGLGVLWGNHKMCLACLFCLAVVGWGGFSRAAHSPPK